MQKNIFDIFNYDTHVSFEFFPPKTSLGIRQIYRSIAKLKDMNPDFVSVTYGAGGSTAEKSLEIASALTNLVQLTCVAHITCVGMSREQITKQLESLEFHGVRNVLALRGDPPSGTNEFVKPENGFAYAGDLVRFIRERSSLGIMVAGYPEGHRENPSKEDDFNHLLGKVRVGANGIITQLFFDNRYMFEFSEKLAKSGIKVPLIAGIFPISNSKQIIRITELSGATIPKDLQAGLEKYADMPEEMKKFGTDFAIKQVKELLDGGVNYFHFYTMNRNRQIREILTQLREFFPRLNFWD